MDFEDDCTALFLKEYTWAQIVAHLNNLNIDQPYWQYMQGMYAPRQHQTGPSTPNPFEHGTREKSNMVEANKRA